MTIRRVAVLGAAGLIGAAVAARLARDVEVLRIARRPGADAIIDLSAPDEGLVRALSAVDAVVHCAGITDEEFVGAPEAAWRRATVAMSRLASLLRLAEVRHVVYVSTAHVYGPLRGPVTERSAADPRSDYAIAHFAAEQMLRRAGFLGGALRPCAVYGDPPDLSQFARWNLAPFAFPRMAVTTGEILLASSGTQRRNFVSAAGVANAAADLLFAGAPWRTVNPVGATTMSIRGWADLVAGHATRITGKACTVRVPTQADASPEAPFTYLSERGDVDDVDSLSAWTDAFLHRLIDTGSHVQEQRRARA